MKPKKRQTEWAVLELTPAPWYFYPAQLLYEAAFTFAILITALYWYMVYDPRKHEIDLFNLHPHAFNCKSLICKNTNSNILQWLLW